MKFSSKRLSQTITQLCLIKEIDHIVISPGSRNAPLTIGFTEHPSFTCFSIVDERCAAFFALGVAQQINRPVALICTSGSALLNYYPAVAEAFYSDIPLVVISADRPEKLVEIGDGQTIRQENVYSNHILYSANCKDGDEFQLKNETEINIALNTAIELQGPVHINAPFEEPLYHKTDDLLVRPQHVPARTMEASEPDFKELAQIWNSSSQKLILTGTLPPLSIDDQVTAQLASRDDLLVFTEATSNWHHPNFIPAIDQLITALNPEEFEALQPELLITFGGMVISKRIKAYLRKYKPKHHWHINKKKAFDTYFSLSEHLRMDPNTFFRKFLPLLQPAHSNYQSSWLQIRKYRLEKHTEYLGTVTYSDIRAYSLVFNSLPKGCQLQLANSATVRYAQLFELKNQPEVFCNRGTSGIDGSTSTAIGAAVASGKQTVYVSGDLSFFYDSNALWNQYIPKDLRIIVINNSGGGIFRILPGAKSAAHFKTYFETSHNLNAANLCEMYDIEYAAVSDELSLKNELSSFYSESHRPRLLEIFTPQEVNDKVLLDYFEFIR
ncbi:2-succinyl-5-enolpyruvyl-6-hydroxy-3-cyclohexene-1-carboxylic-acid synthase [Pukyongia salina]|uniref:2-succinyl-5-enolpyruvyl-6-hydroxy-3-cyclohexene-1-carboxylate synthase n=1 Tax=Pukyongia salina TaxID=2094025 RepID=A0A2S0HYS2_9FLAO|nr:2-succinyl-5-enolpyruvyl-6-hydroxy-3-cyclohexene-1-carboxylic-acid synthase [Pukyongia salina]AVI51765.1 2-succinyl-5-enolpyruvyl-6-hydroxy-3-cyclohexene-1-carboxylic-acid synthase [Pukyongia salina]